MDNARYDFFWQSVVNTDVDIRVPERRTLTVAPLIPPDILLPLYDRAHRYAAGDPVPRIGQIRDAPEADDDSILLTDALLRSLGNHDPHMHGLAINELVSDDAIEYCLAQLRRIYRRVIRPMPAARPGQQRAFIPPIVVTHQLIAALDPLSGANDAARVEILTAIDEQRGGARFLILPCNLGSHYWCIVCDTVNHALFVYDSIAPTPLFAPADRVSRNVALGLARILRMLYEEIQFTVRYCPSESQETVNNGCGYFMIHNVHRFLHFLELRGRAANVIVPDDLLAQRILPNLTSERVTEWRPRLMRAMRDHEIRRQQNIALVDAGSIPPDAEENSNVRFKAYLTPPQRHAANRALPIPQPTNQNLTLGLRNILTEGFRDDCLWQEVRETWWDPEANVRGVLIMLGPDRDNNPTYTVQVLREGQKLYICASPRLQHDGRQRPLTRVQQEAMAVGAGLGLHDQVDLRLMVQDESLRILVAAEHDGGWVQLGRMPMALFGSAPVSVNNIALNTCYRGTARLGDVATIQVDQARFLWLSKQPDTLPLPAAIAYQPVRLLNWLQAPDIIFRRDQADVYDYDAELARDREDAVAAMLAVSFPMTAEAAPPAQAQAGPAAPPAANETGALLSRLLRRMVGSTAQQESVLRRARPIMADAGRGANPPAQPPVAYPAQFGHYHHHHYPERIILDHVTREQYYCTDHPERFPWPANIPPEERDAPAMLRVGEQLLQLMADGSEPLPAEADMQEGTPELWLVRLVNTLRLGIAAYEFWQQTWDSNMEEQVVTCLSPFCTTLWRNQARERVDGVPAGTFVSHRALWSYGAAPCEGDCEHVQEDCPAACTETHYHPLSIPQQHFVEGTFFLRETYFLPDAFFGNSQNRALPADQRAAITATVDRLCPDEATLGPLDFPPLSWMTFRRPATFWQLDGIADLLPHINLCALRLNAWQALTAQQRTRIWNVRTLYPTLLVNNMNLIRTVQRSVDARERFVVDNAMGHQRGAFTRVLHPVVAMYLRRRAEEARRERDRADARGEVSGGPRHVAHFADMLPAQ